MSFPLTFPCPCGKDNSKFYNWIHDNCSNQIVLHLDGDLACQNCNVKSFIQEWSFWCTHDHDGEAEGKWIKIPSITAFFNALAQAGAALEKKGASADALQQMGLNIYKRWINDKKT